MANHEPVNMPCPGRRTRRFLVVIKGFFFALLVISTIAPAAFPVHPVDANSSKNTNVGTTPSQPDSISPNAVGSDSVPDLSLPKTVMTSVDRLIGAGGVLQGSSQNLTLYNSYLALRLLGGRVPHDELLGAGNRAVSSFSFWGAEVQVAGVWAPLVPASSSFELLGTNETGTYVRRIMNVNFGHFSAVLSIVYRATPQGPLKWTLGFTPTSSAKYRLVYGWWNITRDSGPTSLPKRFRVGYDAINYTLSWDDVPSSYNVTSSFATDRFQLNLDLGVLTSNASVNIDPSIVASGVAGGATAYAFQRKVFYDSTFGFYYVFYFDGTRIRWRNSMNGTVWSSPQSMPAGLIDYYYWVSSVYLPYIFYSGKYVLVAAGQQMQFGGIGSVTLRYSLGTLRYENITWGPLTTADTISVTCTSGTCTIGIRYVSATIGSTGWPGFSYNYYESGSATGLCAGTGVSSESAVYSYYAGNRVRESCNYGSAGFDSQQYRSVILNSNSSGQVRVVYEFQSGSSTQILSRWHDVPGYAGTIETVDPSTLGNEEISATTDTNYGLHLLYKGTNGNVTYAFRSSSGSTWTLYSKDIFQGSVSFPVLTADYSTNDIYAFAINGTSIVMRSKTITGSWADRSRAFPVTQRVNPTNLGSNFASTSAVATGANQLLIIWTEGTNPYNAMFASIPIQAVWSPYSNPPDPWNGQGLAPYGQYFSNLGEYVSPSTGMLTIRQTDLTVPGRAISFEVTRVYTEPYSFFTTGPTAGPYLFDSYTWAPIGNGWQLNYPWFTKVLSPSKPTFLHLLDGQGYRVPSQFWNGTTSVFENHQGSQFRLVRNATAIFLFTNSGSFYRFDSTNTYALQSVNDSTGNSSITFSYTNNVVSSVTDSAGRVFQFCYNGSGFLQSIYQTSGSCASPGVARSVSYTYVGSSLNNTSDPARRITSYAYSALSNNYVAPWLLSRITYPTNAYTNYTYRPFALGTQAATYRVFQQLVSSLNSAIRRFDFMFPLSTVGDQITSANVTSLDGSSGSLKVVSYTRYAFSFAGATVNVTDSNGQLIRGSQQRFAVNGEIPREITLVTGANMWYWTKTQPASGWKSQFNWNYSTWSPAPTVGNETQPGAFWTGPIAGWQDTKAKWIWWNRDANFSSTTEPVWFRTSFYVAKSGTFKVNVTADDAFTLYIDGYKIKSGTSWQTDYSNTTSLSVGNHVIGVNATNIVGRAGLIISLRDNSTGQVIVRTDTSIGSYTNYYRYDLWGNQIYSRKSINPSTSSFHETYNSYYNTGLPLGFNAFRDTFSQGNYTRPDESWTVNNGTWIINSGLGFRDPSFISGWTLYDSTGTFSTDGDIGTITVTATSGFPQIYTSGNVNTALYPYLVWRVRGNAQYQVGVKVGSTQYKYSFPPDPNAPADWTTIAWDVKAATGGAIVNLVQLWAIGNNGNYAQYDFVSFTNEIPADQYDGLGQYTGTIGKGAQEATFAWASLNVSDISIRGKLFLSAMVNSSDARAGLIAHYPGSGTGKWALVIHNASGTMKLSMLDDSAISPWKAETVCSGIKIQTWYALNFTLRGTQANGTITGPGVNCAVTASYSGNSLATASGFGLYPGGYSTIFDNITITTVFPYLVGNGFSNSFYTNGGPNSNIHNALAGSGELQNGIGTMPVETYYSYYAWGGLNQQKNRNTPMLSIDGSAINHCSNTTNSCTALLTTTQPNDIIIVFADETLDPATTCYFSISDTAQLSWTARSSAVSGRGGKDEIQEFWAKATSILTADPITESISSCGNKYNGLQVFAIRGANLLTPFDPGSGIPGTGSGQGTVASATVTTTNPFDIVFAGVQHSAMPQTPESGFTAITSVPEYATEYKIPGSTLTNFAVTFTAGNDYYQEIADAVQPASSQNWQTQWPSSSRAYDNYGNLKTLINPRGNVTYYSYSANYTSAYLTNQTSLDGTTKTTTLYAYNFTTGNVRIVTDPKANATSYQNDDLGRVTKITYPLGAFTQYTYSDRYNYVDTNNENNLKTRQIYDGLARETIVDRFNNGASYSNHTLAYNWQNNAVALTDALGNTNRYAYDPLGRATNATQPNGKSVLQIYNDLASWIRSTDQDGNYRCSIYDRLGRRVSTLEKASPDCTSGMSSNYLYDEIGNLRKATNSLSESTSYAFDSIQRLTQASYSDSTNEMYSYDSNGNALNSTDRNGVRTLRKYDSLNRLKTITYCGTTITGTSYTYDKDSNLLQSQNENATISYNYDARNRVLNETYNVNPATRTIVDLGCSGSGGSITRAGGSPKIYTVGYSYNGELLSAIYYPTIIAVNIGVRYSYDGLGRVLNVTQSGSTAYFARSLTYDKNDRILGLQFGNGLVGNYTYDTLLRPQTITLKNGGTTMISLTYTYNNTGTVASVTGSVNGVAVNEQYRYDAQYRLTNYTVTSNSATTSGWYQYDNLGNRLTQKLNTTITRYSYNSVNELTNSTTYSSPQVTTAYSYDLNGNLKTQNVTGTSTTRWTYNWDNANHLLKVLSNGIMQGTYAYDNAGRKVESTECTSCQDIWFYAYYGAETLWQTDANWGSIDFLTVSAMKVATVDSSVGNCYCTAKYYHLDLLGSTRLVTSASKSITFTDGYQPFGRDSGTPNSSENYKFTGKPYSPTTGLYYFFQRWYDPGIGRFISADPNPTTCAKCENPYSYVRDQPTRLFDRNGAQSADAIVANAEANRRRAEAANTDRGVSADVYLARHHKFAEAGYSQVGPCLAPPDVCLGRLGHYGGPTTIVCLAPPDVCLGRLGHYGAGNPAETEGSNSQQGQKDPLQPLWNILDILPPCAQIIIGSTLVFLTPLSIVEVLAAFGFFAPETAGLSIVAGLFVAGFVAIEEPIVGGLLLARGVQRGGNC